MPASKFALDKTNTLVYDMAKTQYKQNPTEENKALVYKAMENKKFDTGIIAEHEIAQLKEGIKAVGGSAFTMLSTFMGLPPGLAEGIVTLGGATIMNHIDKKKRIKKLEQDKEIAGRLHPDHVKAYKEVEREVRGKTI